MKPQPTTLIQHITHYGHGDIYAAQGVDTRIKADLVGYALWAGGAVLVGSTLYGLALGAVAFGVAAAPYVFGGALTVGATWAGIKGAKAHQTRLLAQAAAQPAPLLLCPEALEMAARLADRGVQLTESDLQACERLAQRIKQCASLPSSGPVSASHLSQSELQYSTLQSKSNGKETRL